MLGVPPTPFLLALAHLLRGVSPTLARSQLPALLPWLLDSAEGLLDGPLADPGLTQHLLLIVAELLMEPAGVLGSSFFPNVLPALLLVKPPKDMLSSFSA